MARANKLTLLSDWDSVSPGGDEMRYANWNDYLPLFEHEYNSTVHASSGMSSNEPRFACQPRGIADLLYPFEGKSESAEILAESLKSKRDDAHDAIAMAQRKQKRLYDRKHCAKEFNVVDHESDFSLYCLFHSIPQALSTLGRASLVPFPLL